MYMWLFYQRMQACFITIYTYMSSSYWKKETSWTAGKSCLHVIVWSIKSLTVALIFKTVIELEGKRLFFHILIHVSGYMESFLFLASKTYCLLRQKPINLFSEREYALERLQKKIPGISFKCDNFKEIFMILFIQDR